MFSGQVERRRPVAQKQLKETRLGSVLAGRYELVAVLGEGGMGSVFLARHQLVGRQYALKIMWATQKEDEARYKRFIQESRVAGSFNHPNLASVYDYGETEEAYPFMVMDLVAGVSLERLLNDEGPLDLQRAVRIFWQICAGLAYAHERGLVHRDVKPANIMILNDNGVDQVKIVDFGISKVLEHGGQTMPELTKAGELFGSPLYLSPEQCLGHAVDQRSDIYSLGCVMFQTLTGHPPFSGETSVETIVMHLHAPVPPLTGRKERPALITEIEAIVDKCLAKEVEDRYQKVTEVACDLTRLSEKAARPELVQDKENICPGSKQDAVAAPVSNAQVPYRCGSYNIRQKPIAIAVQISVCLILAAFLQYLLAKTQNNKPAPAGINASRRNVNVAVLPTPPIAEDKSSHSLELPDRKQTRSTSSSSQPIKNAATRMAGQPEPAGKSPDETFGRRQAPAAGNTGKPEGKVAIAAVAETIAEGKKNNALTGTPSDRVPAVRQMVATNSQTTDNMADANLLSRVQSQVVPGLRHDVDKIVGQPLNWEIDWRSFNQSRSALTALQYGGLDEIREAFRESASLHSQQELTSAIKSVRIKNVRHIYERQVSLKNGVLSINGAWTLGAAGSPGALEIQLAIATGLESHHRD